jgi:hydroxyacyl-ACP dehydratase HTD2-like protein with hotdog domain
VTAENALDSMDLSTHQTRHHFIEPEMSAFDFFPQYIEYNSTVSSDKAAGRMFEQPFFSETESLHLPAFYSVDTFDSGDIYTFESEFFVLRNKELVDNGLDFPSGKLGTGSWYGNSFGPTPEVISKFSDMTFNSHKIYDNRKVSILVNRLQ